MRKETSAAIRAGAVAGVPIGFYFAVRLLLTAITSFESQFGTKLPLVPNATTILLIIEVITVVISVALFSFLGVIAGFIFVKAVNKLPFRSSYVKAMLPWAVLTILGALSLIYNPALNGAIGFATHQLPLYALQLADAIPFAFLFNRWSK
jgi:hypothetical protein